jgi:phosphoribosylaminoimidazolecarboxamide formyltransferase/IMP cyclohydrolase
VSEIFTEVIIAPDYDEAAFETLRAKKNLRILRAPAPRADEIDAVHVYDYKKISGGMLMQTCDTHRLTRDELNIVSRVRRLMKRSMRCCSPG